MPSGNVGNRWHLVYTYFFVRTPCSADTTVASSFRNFANEDAPPYVFLSYTWLTDNSEVSFQDIEAGTGNSKTEQR